MSQDELRRVLLIRSSTLRAYERGTKRPRAAELSKIAKALGVPLSFFFEEVDHCAEIDPDSPADPT